MMKKLIFALCLMFSNFSWADTIDGSVVEELKKMTKSYSAAPYFQAKFKQKQIMELLGDSKTAKGELYYSKQKLRIELKGEQNSSTLFTPGVITSVTYDEKMNPVQVLSSKPYPHPLLSLIFGDEKAWDDFEVTEVKRNTKTVLEVQLSPKDAKKIPGIDRLEVTLNKKKSEIQKIIYWDDIGNETMNEFVSQKKSEKVDGAKFILVPPSGVEVKNL